MASKAKCLATIVIVLFYAFIYEIPASTYSMDRINVRHYRALGDGKTDDTAAIQQAIDQAERTGQSVYIPDGTYMIDAVKSLNVNSHITISMAEHATLAAIPTSNGKYAVLTISNASDVLIQGGNIAGERNGHTGNQGEHGFGILIWDAQNISLTNLKITDCWGDGIYIGGTLNKSSGINISNVTFDNNRRQGISITSGDHIVICDANITNTGGCSPSDAIDIEPNSGNMIGNIFIINLNSKNNRGFALNVYMMNGSRAKATNIIIDGLTSVNDNKGSLSIGGLKDRDGNEINIQAVNFSSINCGSGILLADIGGGAGITVNAQIESDGTPAIFAYRNSSQKTDITGIPDIHIKAGLSGTGAAFQWATNTPLDTNMSKGISLELDNGDRYVDLYGSYSAPNIILANPQATGSPANDGRTSDSP